VDHHLERGLRLHKEPEHKNLYSWAINELDEQGRTVGHDQIPWPWMLRFTATSCSLGDSINIKTRSPISETPFETREIEQRQIIRLQLRPGDPGDDDPRWYTKFSMFGTDRIIKDFHLEIHPIADLQQEESCSAWGTVSYTADIDFRDHTFDDCVVFYLHVRPEAFARYAAKMSDGAVDDIVFSVGSVDGFYSDWSPSISTDSVKVLTPSDEHRLDLPPGLGVEPPRLGRVGEANLYIDRRLQFGKREEPRPEVEDEPDEGVPPLPAPPPVAMMDPQAMKALRSLKRAAWFGVAFLALIFIAVLSRN
jgi:hypothetical protein